MKSIINKFIVWAVFAWLLPFVANSQTPLTNGLVAYYSFNGTSDDFSGQNFHGTNVGVTYTADRFGNPNNTANFAGNSNYVQLPPASINNLNNGTIAAWISLRDINDGTITAKQHDSVNSYSLLTVGYLPSNGPPPHTNFGVPGRLYFHPKNNDPFPASSTSLLSTSRWYHVAVVFSTTNVSFFIDGNLDSNTIGDYSVGDDLDTRNIIGGYINPPNAPHWFNGLIDDLRIYNRALTPAEITTLGGSHLFKTTFRASCRTTNNLGVLVSRPIANRDLIRDCAQEHGITNIASLALVYDVFADEVQVVQASDGSRVCGVVSFQDSVSVQSADGTRRERHAFLFTEDNDQAIGSAVGTEQEVLDANGNLKKFKFSGDLQFGLSATETKGARVCKGTFSTGAKFVPKNPAP